MEININVMKHDQTLQRERKIRIVIELSNTNDIKID